MASSLFASLLTCLISIATLALAQSPQDPIKDFCRRYAHQTAVINGKLYIDRGYLNANPLSQNRQSVINQGLFYQDLTKTSGAMPVPFDDLTKNASVAGGILWADEVNRIFYQFGGEFSDVPESFKLWGYDTILDQWNQTSSPPADYHEFLMALTPAWGSAQIATANLVKYDMVQDTWTNNTGPDDIGRAEGTMVYVPASASGLLAYFGGVTSPYGNETTILADMSKIIIYEIAEGKWYTQTATGQIPEQRRKFCGGAAWAQDQSSYNIYIYGGAGFGANATGFDDIYILTFPAFQWIKWYPDAPGPGAPHNSLTCNVVNNAQMVVIGGTFPNPTQCDAPDVVGTHNMNLGKNDPTQAKCFLFDTKLKSYDVRSEIIAVVGGSASGGATLPSPKNGWDNRDLPVYFQEKASFTAPTPTRAIPTSKSTSKAGSSHKTPHAGAIAGGIVGGIAFLAILSILLFFCIHRRHKQRKQTAEPHQKSSPPKNPTNIHPTPKPSTNLRTSLQNLPIFTLLTYRRPQTRQPNISIPFSQQREEFTTCSAICWVDFSFWG